MRNSKDPSGGIASQLESEFLGVIDSLQKSSKYTDLTIKCKNFPQSFEVHRCIVLSQSSVLEETYRSEGKLEMKYNPLLVTKMIDYFYTRDYKLHDLDISTSSFKELIENYIDDFPFEVGLESCYLATLLGPLAFHMMMYSLADCMGISGLKLLAKDHSTRSLVDNMTPEGFSLSINVIYSLTTASTYQLRDIAAQATIDSRVDLRWNHDGKQMALGNDLMDDVPEFARDVLVAIMDRDVEHELRSAW